MDEQQQTPTQQPDPVQPQWHYQSGQLEQQGGFGSQMPPQQPEVPAEQQQTQPNGQIVGWTASEFVSHEKSLSWYVLLGGGAVVLAGFIFLLTRAWFSIVVILVLAVALGVFGALKPRTLTYAIYPDGIQIGDKHFEFELFRSFAIIEDSVVPSLQLLPIKRFMAPITIYFAPADVDKIINTLGDFLPVEQKKRDMVDKLSSHIRF